MTTVVALDWKCSCTLSIWISADEKEAGDEQTLRCLRRCCMPLHRYCFSCFFPALCCQLRLKTCISQETAASKPHWAQKLDPLEDLVVHCVSAHLPCGTCKILAFFFFFYQKNDQGSCPRKYCFEFHRYYTFKVISAVLCCYLLVGCCGSSCLLWVFILFFILLFQFLS